MGTNYYFRKKDVDMPQLYAIVDALNDECKVLVAKYNELLNEARREMGIEYERELKHWNTYTLPDEDDDIGDIHVGKISYGWKPLMKAGEHFHSIETLQRWHEQNRGEYVFIDEYGKTTDFEEYLMEIHKRNEDAHNKPHDYPIGVDGFEWTSREFC